MPKTFKDNRYFIEALEKTGDLKRIKDEVDWDLEAGALSRLINETLSPTALLEKVKDYPEHRLLVSPLTTRRRLAIALGLEPESPIEKMQAIYEERIAHPLKPIMVKDAPCRENIKRGKEVNLFDFPAPMVHGGDGGRYIGTWHLVITRDPDSDWVNWGMYRTMVYNKKLMSISLHRGNDGGKIMYNKYWARKKAMPVALAIGADPLCSLIAATLFTMGKSEVEFAGALHGNPVELVRAETVDLPVPAFAEIILEGEVPPGAMLPSGPFGEHLGYRTEARPMPLCLVKAITFRHNPILTMSCPGIPHSEGDVGPGLAAALEAKNLLKANGSPVSQVYFPPEGAMFTAVVSLRRGHGIANAASQVRNVLCARGRGRPDKFIVVDDDVNIFNLGEVFHALATKCHPLRGIKTSDREIASGLTPYLSVEERDSGSGSTALFDCTWPANWPVTDDVPPRVSFKDDYPEEVQKEVLKKWGKSKS